MGFFAFLICLTQCNVFEIHARSDICHQFLFFFFFMAVPVAYGNSWAGVEAELQLPAYTTATATRDPSASVARATAYSNAGSLTH